MTRLRIGQHWKREPSASPVDSIALELDGVNLLAGAVEEPLAEVVPALVGAVAALHAGKRRLAQVSLPEATWSWCCGGWDRTWNCPWRASPGPPTCCGRPCAWSWRSCGGRPARRKRFLADVTRLAPEGPSAALARGAGGSLRGLLGGPPASGRRRPPEPSTPPGGAPRGARASASS